MGPARENDGRQNLFGGLRMALGAAGYADLKGFQQAEVMVAPAVRTEGKELQRRQQVGMG